jgi:SagB-type dehydrogenase family enzyme
VRPALERERRLRYRVLRNDEAIATFLPAVGLAGPVEPMTQIRVRLSRFAHVRRDGDTLILDSPRALGRVVLHSPRALASIAGLATPATAADLASDSGEPVAWCAALVGLLCAAAVLTVADDTGITAEDREPAKGWEFHDLVMHERSRPFRSDRPVGATNRFGESTPEPSAARGGGATIALARPDITALSKTDVPFTQVLETRRSRRFHGDAPITFDQLSEFLFRTLRTTSRDGADAQAAGRFRVYPGGGACHPLEAYVVVARCNGLAAGVYHYLADSHALAPIDCDAGAAQSLIRQSAVPMERGSEQQLQLVLTARFAVINRRYEGNAYALIMQEVGAVYQTMYLVATAMGLAGCAVGGGNADAFARLIGTNPLEESSVGAFVLGSA